MNSEMIINTILASSIAGLISSVATVASLKTDIINMKENHNKLENKLTHHEDKYHPVTVTKI